MPPPRALESPALDFLAGLLGVEAFSVLRSVARRYREHLADPRLWRLAKRGRHVWSLVSAADNAATLQWVARTFAVKSTGPDIWRLIGDLLAKDRGAQAIWLFAQQPPGTPRGVLLDLARDCVGACAVAYSAGVGIEGGARYKTMPVRREGALYAFIKRVTAKLALTRCEHEQLVLPVGWPDLKTEIAAARAAGDVEWAQYLGAWPVDALEQLREI